MQRSALLIGAGIVTAACFGCVPPPSSGPTPPPSSGPTPVATGPSPLTCNPGPFLSKVSYLATSFQPGKHAPLPTPGSLPSIPNYAGDLGNAFCQAPPGFQKALLNDVDYVYINAGPCPDPADCFATNSWGWWRNRPPAAPQRIIALSANLWIGPDPKPIYSKYETDLGQSLFPPSVSVTYSAAQSCPPVGICTNIDTFETTLLAALAHEMGHIRWYDFVAPDAKNYCGGDFFGKPGGNPANGYNSWGYPVQGPPDWRELLTSSMRIKLRHAGKLPNSHKNPPHIADIDEPLPGGTPANQLVYDLVAPTQPWASFFAATVPDEDFVEAYKFKVLTDPSQPLPLTGLDMSVAGAGGGNANIPADYAHKNKADLATKLNCIQAF
jgi:hypothetical protein